MLPQKNKGTGLITPLSVAEKIPLLNQIPMVPTTIHKSFKPIDSTNTAGFHSPNFKALMEADPGKISADQNSHGTLETHPKPLVIHSRIIKPRMRAVDIERKNSRIRGIQSTEPIKVVSDDTQHQGNNEILDEVYEDLSKPILIHTDNIINSPSQPNDSHRSLQVSKAVSSTHTSPESTSPATNIGSTPYFYTLDGAVIIILDHNHPRSSRIPLDHLNWILRYVNQHYSEVALCNDWDRAAEIFQKVFSIHISAATLETRWGYIERWVEYERPVSSVQGFVLVDSAINSGSAGMGVSVNDGQISLKNHTGWLAHRVETIRLAREREGEVYGYSGGGDDMEVGVEDNTDEVVVNGED